MNYKDLLTKLQAIEEGHTPPIAPTHTDGPAEEEMMGISLPMPGMIGHEEAPKQSDNVSMNVSLNGQGAGGVRDLMNILHNIEKGATGAEHDDIVFGEPGEQHERHPHIGDDEMEETMGDNGQTFGNSVHGDHGTHVHGIDAVTATGDDLASKGKASPLQRAPGVNPLRRPMEEGLVKKLQNLYNEIKTRDLNENVLTDETGHTMQHILHTHQRDVRDFEQNGDMSDSLYDALYDYYFDDMPYGVKKARDGDPYEWISDRFADDLGISETVAMNQQVEENQAGHDYQTGEPLKQGPDGKWYNSKGEERDPMHGGPLRPDGSATLRSLVPKPPKPSANMDKPNPAPTQPTNITPPANSDNSKISINMPESVQLAEMLKIAGLK